MAPARILVVDDEAVDRMACRRALARGAPQAYECVEAESAAQALECLARDDFDCVLLDYRLPDMDGLELIDRLRAGGSRAAVVMLTGAADVAVAVEAMRRGASDYIVKDFEHGYQALIPSVVQRVMRDHEIRRAKASAEQTLQVIVASASDAIVSTDADGRITLFNPSAEHLFGCTAADAVGAPLQRFFEPVAGQVAGRRADGGRLELEVSLARTTVEDRSLAILIVREVTQRVQAEQALARYRQQLSELTQQLLAQEKATTRRIAQSLHDNLGQTLMGMRMFFDAAQAEGRPALPQPDADRLSALIDQAIGEVRQVLVELRPPQLDELGLAAALDYELRRRERSHPGVVLRLEVAAGCEEQRWPADVEYAAFMIAREALVNALRHAQASTLRVRLGSCADGLRMHIDDDGRGIDDGALTPQPGHLGIVGMRERALAIGAHWSVARNAGGGTTVSLHWDPG